MTDAARRSIRFAHFLYRGAAYFVTICAFEQRWLFGRLEHGTMFLSRLGRIIDEEWQRTPVIREDVTLDAWVVMPNHIHAIVYVPEAPGDSAAPEGFVRAPRSLASLIAGFKSSVTRRARSECSWPKPVWQRNYFEHIIRGKADLGRARRYIAENPEKWGARCAPLPRRNA